MSRQNPHAFPTGEKTAVGLNEMHTENGMSLRDYFAADAMQAIMIGMAPGVMATGDGPSNDRIAAGAYAMADAMLKARG